MQIGLGRARELTSVVPATAPGTCLRLSLAILIIRQLLLEQGLGEVGMAPAW